MGNLINELTDLRRLEWSATRHSSGTAGSFLKAYEKKNGEKIYYKLSQTDFEKGIVGHECINELVADRLMTELQIPHLSYDLVHARVIVREQEYETYLCRSKDFKKKGESKTALDVFYDMEHLPKERPIDFCDRMGFSDFVDDMLTIDYLIVNRDRHGANIEIIKNSRDRKLYPAPIFDNGLSLLFNCRDDKEIDEFDLETERKIQCFVGSDNSLKNLELIKRMRSLPEFDLEMKKRLFDGLGPIMTEAWVEKVWSLIKKRAEIYENIRTEK